MARLNPFLDDPDDGDDPLDALGMPPGSTDDGQFMDLAGEMAGQVLQEAPQVDQTAPEADLEPATPAQGAEPTDVTTAPAEAPEAVIEGAGPATVDAVEVPGQGAEAGETPLMGAEPATVEDADVPGLGAATTPEPTELQSLGQTAPETPAAGATETVETPASPAVPAQVVEETTAPPIVGALMARAGTESLAETLEGAGATNDPSNPMVSSFRIQIGAPDTSDAVVDEKDKLAAMNQLVRNSFAGDLSAIPTRRNPLRFGSGVG